MGTVAEPILDDVFRFGNSTFNDEIIPSLGALQAGVLDFTASVAAEGVTLGDLSDFEEALKELNGLADNLNAACDTRFRIWCWACQPTESSEHSSREKRLVRLGIRSSYSSIHCRYVDSIPNLSRNF